VDSSVDMCFKLLLSIVLSSLWPLNEISLDPQSHHITRSFLTVTVVNQMVTRSFDASWFEVTVVFGVPISLAICTLSNIPFAFGWFEFYFSLLYIFHVEYIFIILGWFQVYKEH
jgi:hypothetical protein